MSAERSSGVYLLKTFVPFDRLKRENLAALAKKVSLRRFTGGQVLFSEGDIADCTMWLVSGAVEILEGGSSVGTIRAATEAARQALCPGNPRPSTVRALEPVSCLSLDSELLDLVLTWDQTGVYEVSELCCGETDGGDDWMTTLLRSQAFRRVPPANLQAIFPHLERLPVKAGATVIRQGEEGNYFYTIMSGKALVSRETPLNTAGLKLAELGVGDSFGEDALIAETQRNATVRMLTDGVLMRLDKQHFRELMTEPLLQWVDWERARQIVAHGGLWLDARLPAEHQLLSIEGSINIPLYFIRMKLGQLDRKTPYVVYCDTGRRSSAEAHILTERGFDAYVLEGGLNRNGVALRRTA